MSLRHSNPHQLKEGSIGEVHPEHSTPDVSPSSNEQSSHLFHALGLFSFGVMSGLLFAIGVLLAFGSWPVAHWYTGGYIPDAPWTPVQRQCAQMADFWQKVGLNSLVFGLIGCLVCVVSRYLKVKAAPR